jgi:hypothetical protein
MNIGAPTPQPDRTGESHPPASTAFARSMNDTV